MHAELRGSDGAVSWTEIAGTRAVRRRHEDAPATMVDFFLLVPGRPGPAKDMVARSPGLRRGRDEKSLAALLETAGAMARQADDASIALLLYPSHQDGLKALVRFCPVDLAGREGDDAWDALLASLPADSVELDHAHPGASPHARLGTGPGPALIGLAAAVIILVVVGVAVYLATH